MALHLVCRGRRHADVHTPTHVCVLFVQVLHCFFWHCQRIIFQRSFGVRLVFCIDLSRRVRPRSLVFGIEVFGIDFLMCLPLVLGIDF